MSETARLAQSAKAWPFELARTLLKRIEKQRNRSPETPVVFETGYGPSGLPHIGTFGEVVRTTMVRKAFETLTDHKYPTRLICVSDDLDGMRKVPQSVPNAATLEPFLQKPLTDVPDPFGTHDSYAAHMNDRLKKFLDDFDFDYQFYSATDLYRSGRYDETLLRALEKFDEIMAVMKPTLGAERQKTYSPFLPISPTTGHVLYVPMKATDPSNGTITFEDEDGVDVTIPVTGGRTKLQWKPDFGMRWAALGVDFEMFGKDHQDNAKLYSKICRILGKEPPVQYVYELFLDQNGEKISKSIGNGIAVEEWLMYGPPASLSLFQFQKPRVAKKLYLDIIPKTVDEYFRHLNEFPNEEPARQLENPVWHVHASDPPACTSPISFSLLIKLVSASNADDKKTLWGFISRYAPETAPETHPQLDELVGFAIQYYTDRIKPHKQYRSASATERTAMQELAARIRAETVQTSAEGLQSIVYEVGKDHNFEPLRVWFQTLYQVLFGQSQGPRFGSFIALYGQKETADLIDSALARQDQDAGSS